MKADDLYTLLNEVFYEDIYKIVKSGYNKYDSDRSVFYISRFSERLGKHMACAIVKEYLMGTIYFDEVWEIEFDNLSGIRIVDHDALTFLYMFKDRTESFLKAKAELSTAVSKLDELKNPINIIREYKLNKIL